MENVSVFWFRRDFRLDDNVGLCNALSSGLSVLPIFIFDTNILDKLENRADARVDFIHQEVSRLKEELKGYESDLLVLHGDPLVLWKDLVSQYSIKNVIYNHDYESYAIVRDDKVTSFLKSKHIEVQSFKDHVIFEKSEVVKDAGSPYTVFTPYKKKWLAKLNEVGESINQTAYLEILQDKLSFKNLYKVTSEFDIPSLKTLGFYPSDQSFISNQIDAEIITHYNKTRDFPSLKGTSKLGLHLRFGTISIRKLANLAIDINPTYLNELIWRDFYFMILHHFPHVEKSAFRPAYDEIEWRNNENEFGAWCQGKTGYPLVDAGMRELQETGFMHNRVRMVTASFLTKHLLIDWRWGEAWFASKLLDFELASNNGGWQWAAGCGTDAAPYFRIFNPTTQAQKFDKDMSYIKKWVPELNEMSYSSPIVDHKFARERCLRVYKQTLNRKA